MNEQINGDKDKGLGEGCVSRDAGRTQIGEVLNIGLRELGDYLNQGGVEGSSEVKDDFEVF